MPPQVSGRDGRIGGPWTGKSIGLGENAKGLNGTNRGRMDRP